ncbi:MerR family transcriptional regulator [Cupriavidus basilensis]|uniref:MerR family transcriptional regulator n=1 Tax=Cupriavidus basilensis TaxID=68895 RepID=A0ABT6AYL9_9BURK|nr:MerR family transcriptional regulator [Cupriavidus basilensis]MDF3837721.1 MerR family transcriptional regulator [Cupriavidus basilensis]
MSEVARRTGLPSATVRFYEKKGLITATRSAGERRRFASGVLDQLALIAPWQAGGLSLAEIRAMPPSDGAPRVDGEVLLAKADNIDATIKRLRTMSQGLRHAAECPAANHAQCPTFQRLLKAAAGR